MQVGEFSNWASTPSVRCLVFILEGHPHPDDVDPFGVHLHGFRVADPAGREQSERETTMERLLKRMESPRRYRMMPDGTLRETSDGES
jgi:hypothetical protein